MAEIRSSARAEATFRTFCQTLEKNDWRYKKDEENMVIDCGARGDDLPMDLRIKVDADKMLVILFSHLPFVIQEDKRLDTAVAVSAINNVLVDGCFDFDLRSGHMFFRMTNSFIESVMGMDAMEYMLYCSCQTIDEYNDKFLMLSKGMITIEQFIKSI